MQEIKLWEHQKEGIARALKHDNYAFLYDPGTGKTNTTIQVLRHMFARIGALRPTLILAPIIVLENWKDEFAKFSKIPQDRILVLNGSIEKRIRMLHEFEKKFRSDFIVITNYEALAVSDNFFKEIYRWAPKFVIADESHKIKNPSAKRTKKVISIGSKAQHRYCLTGTPVLNSPMDIYAQWRFLDNGRTFGTNFYIFRSMYFYDKNAGMPKEKYFPNWVIRPGSIEQLNKKIFRIAMKATKAECLDLPPFIRQVINVKLTDSQEKLYESMKKNFIAFLQDKATVASIALTKCLRMMQIVSGFIKFEDDTEVDFDRTPREVALEELLEGIAPSHKVIVWAVFHRNYEVIRKVCNKLKLPCVELTGEIGDKKKYENVEAFNNNPDIRVLIGNPNAGGLGVNLTASSYSIYYSRTYSLEADIQSEARNYRGGSEIHEKITRIDIVAKGTIDEIIVDALQKKMDTADKMLAYIKEKL